MPNLRKSSVTRAIDRNIEAAKNRDSVAKFSVSVFPRYNGSRKAKHAFLYISIAYQKDRCLFSSGIECNPTDFDSKALTIKGEPEKTLYLKNMVQDAETCYHELKITKRAIDLYLIKATVLGQYIQGIPTLQIAVDKFFELETSKEKAGIVSIGHWRKVRGFHNHIRAFMYHQYRLYVPLEYVVPAHAQAMLIFLQAEQKLSSNVANYIVAHFKRILNFALENEWITRNPLMNFKRKTDYSGKARLTREDLRKLETAEIFAPSLDRIRWVFLFDCYTGLSHIDLYALTPAHVQHTTEGDAFIMTVRTKTKQPTITYLPTVCLDIIERFKNDPYRIQTGKLLPVVSNQKMNLLLKEIAGIVGLKKHLTCHVARHTFLNLLYQTQTDEKAMRAAAGHGGMDTMRKHYIEYDPESIVRELKRNIG